ncbi:MAG: hypothetical protein QXS21_05455 [Thermoproteota archaeon]
MTKDILKVKGYVRIQLTDKETGKVVYDSGEIEQVITLYGAMRVMNCYDAVGTVSGSANKVNLYYTGGDSETPVKSLTGSWGTRVNTGTALQNTLTAQDTSSDAYSFRYLGLDTTAPLGWLNNLHKHDYGSVVNKGSNQTLTVSWRISIPFS